ncbi:hypothetical protein, partial [Draconibacterium mangrovi]|uniref:hypothetical protein n=1 Tax=Draconibacterium mangrovi TaxID=2697469 RepID=UPI001952DD2A
FPTTGPAFAVLYPTVSMNIASLKAAAKVIKVFNNASTLGKLIATILGLKSQVTENLNRVN